MRTKVKDFQVQVQTKCQLCRKVFPNPSVAAQHIQNDHKRRSEPLYE